MSWYEKLGFRVQWSSAPEKPKVHDPATHGDTASGWTFLYGEESPADQLPHGVAYEMKPIGIRWADGCEELYERRVREEKS